MKRTLVCLMVLGAFLALVAAPVSAETLELLTWKGYAPKELIDKFQAETGITVKPTYSNNEEMIAKLRATRGAGFDLAQPSQDRISSVQAEFKIYQPIDYSQLKTDQIVASMLEAVKKNTLVDGKSYAVPHVYGTSGMIVNRKYAADAKDYTDLLDSKYKGRVSYRLKRPTLIGMAFAMGKDPFALYSDSAAYEALSDETKAELDGDTVVVQNDEIAAPTQVRYAFSRKPSFANLFNKDGLPALTFRAGP